MLRDRISADLRQAIIGHGDVQRRALDDGDVKGILVSEIEEWERSMAEYQRIGQTERAEGLQRELEILRSYLSQG